jgi:hypothetical protein
MVPVLLAPDDPRVWLATALAALPTAILLHDGISAQLGSSLIAKSKTARRTTTTWRPLSSGWGP